MKSKASINSHPIHPILIAFPIAFFIGSLLFDVLALFWNNDALQTSAYYLNIAGVVSALAAAIPGFIDYLTVVPPKSSAKKRATKHALINISVVIVFAVVLVYRQRDDARYLMVIGLEVVGVVLLSIAGWMGGTLVYRNQIGVDIRYAEAGKWKEITIDSTEKRIEVANMDELKVNGMKLIKMGDKRIVLGRTENGYAAFDDFCTHRGGSLAGGAMICGTVQCPWHGSQFDVKTGTIKAGPAKENIATYNVIESNGKVYLEF
jgi:uncharacterized membrane protein/nitrite reductase/ring-hydroxylating ferredoxin subunit